MSYVAVFLNLFTVLNWYSIAFAPLGTAQSKTKHFRTGYSSARWPSVEQLATDPGIYSMQIHWPCGEKNNSSVFKLGYRESFFTNMSPPPPPPFLPPPPPLPCGVGGLSPPRLPPPLRVHFFTTGGRPHAAAPSLLNGTSQRRPPPPPRARGLAGAGGRRGRDPRGR